MKINRSNLLNICMFVLLLIAGMFFSVCMKNDNYWDLANYHYYNAFAFLHDRLNYDIVPASVNTFFNPLIDLPLYFYIQHFNDNVDLIYALQGIWGGLLLFVFYKIYLLFFKTESWIDYVFLGLALIISISGQTTFYQIGASTNEIPIAFFTLFGFYILLKMVKFPLLQKIWKFFIAGLIMGIGLGFKQTSVTYCLAAGLSLIICRKYLNKPFKSIFYFALGGLLGYFVINGYFMYKYFVLYGNPFFPFLNGIFHSPYFDNFNYTDRRFIPSIEKFLIYPFLWNFSKYSVAETTYIDLRLTFVYLFLLIFPIVILKKKNLSQFVAQHRVIVYSFIFLFLSFFLWMGVFSILRYAVVIEVLSTLVFIKIIQYLFLKPQKLILPICSIVFLFLILLIPIYNGGWGKYRGDNNQFFEMEKIKLPENTLLKLYGFPSAFVVPEFAKHASVQALGYMQYNCEHQKGSDFVERGAFRAMRDKIEKEHKGPVAIIWFNNAFFQKNQIPLNTYKQNLIKCKETPSCFINFCETSDKTIEIMLNIPNDYFCRPLKNNIEKRLNICVPEEFKKQILGEEND